MNKRFVFYTATALSLVITLSYSAHADDRNRRQESDFQILRHERLRSVKMAKKRGRRDAWTMSAPAFGKKLLFDLEKNTDLVANLRPEQRSSAATSLRLYRGQISGVPRSWVRLTQNGEHVSGMAWDGSELYVVEWSDDIVASLPRAAAPAQPTHVLYRLSDTIDLSNRQCAFAPHAPISQPLQNYRSMVQELQQLVTAEAATRRLNIAAVADAQFRLANSTNPQAAVLARLNVVDGIFSGQVGVQLNPVEIRILQDNGGLTATSPGTLLNQFSTFAASPGFTNPGLAHLLTGRDLDGATIGIAYVAALCSARFGVGVSQVTDSGGTSGALTMAHEIGHNFGAPHDNQSGSPCASTPGTFLMNPFLNGIDTFSQCSLQQIQPRVTAATCITPITNPPPPPPPPTGSIFTARFNTGRDGFSFTPDTFQRTRQPAYANGAFIATGGFSGGGLRVLLGGRDNNAILGMSGGWTRTFTLATTRNVTLTLRYNLLQAANYEPDEFSLALVSIDGRQVGPNAGNSLARIAGDGEGGAARGTGWVNVQLSLGSLAAGTHRLTIGGFNNKKTFSDEVTQVLIDDVIVQ